MSKVDTTIAAIEAALDPGCFVLPTGRLRVERRPDEAHSWEIFRGHLLAEDQTRQVERFDAWHVYVDEPDAEAPVPLISLLWDRRGRRVHAVRRILSHAFEAYEESAGVIRSRPTQRWLRELVGTIDLQHASADRLPSELRHYLYAAVSGTSRLPIASHESPLPAFSLGHLAYLPGLPPSANVNHDPIALLRAALAGRLPVLQQAKALEVALRAVSEDRVPEIATSLGAFAADPAQAESIQVIWQTLFNHVALSPYTGFVDRWVATLARCADEPAIGIAATVDAVGWMLRHLCRHLTAFDLTTFHNYGANFPDALFLDALLKEFVHMLARDSRCWHDDPTSSDQQRRTCRLRRRALRQACIVRRHYEGQRVPDVPTSQGENLRVMPASFTRVPDEQILQAGARRRTLFDGEPLEQLLGQVGNEALRASVTDLTDIVEVRELGMAYFLDRPLGVGKGPGVVDRTPLVSYIAFSRAIAAGRIAELASGEFMEHDDRRTYETVLNALKVGGLSVESLPLVERPGVVSLADARRASPDFVVLSSTQRSLGAVWSRYRWPTELPDVNAVLLVGCGSAQEPGGSASLRVYDTRWRLRAELELPTEQEATSGYVEQDCTEFPRRMRVIRASQSGEPLSDGAAPPVAGGPYWMTLVEGGIAPNGNMAH